ncbi:glycosyltransferase family 2 protein [Gordonia insulae]|uniref:Mycofactocin biosynthesis glycosyltransferase MftF n=1 Tax=Gordonia insulae TaxID=2420509 RepID=A0A3G8JLE8_9ACTN|nr:glycosyltransferase [Gordonia insulae]AZG45708.1 Putative mycofactocin biosynthesis glycosyltransferase MftF [Gordonia insulae]
MTAPLRLVPAMPSDGEPEWPGATWVGVLDLADVHRGQRIAVCAPDAADGYAKARILIRDGFTPLSFVHTELIDGLIHVELPDRASEATGDARASEATGDAPASEATPVTDPALPPISVVICTRERPDQLIDALRSLRRLDYPDYEIVVVDNAPTGDATERVVAELADDRIRRIVEPVAGLSNARNAGLRGARHGLVAFTDDDVVADRGWLRGLAAGFARDPDVACVCGMVPSGELRTRPQAYFDWRVSWAASLVPRVYSLNDPPEDVPLFPFQVGVYGTGANFAVDRARALELGGFDEALGAGTRTKGGEDLDMFFRVLAAGHALANEPASIVWHRHRSDTDALLSQARGYGLGLGAWLTKVAIDRGHRRLAFSVLRRRFRAVTRAGVAYGAIAVPPPEFAAEMSRSVGRVEVFSVLSGPVALGRERLRGRRSRPLSATTGHSPAPRPPRPAEPAPADTPRSGTPR